MLNKTTKFHVLVTQDAAVYRIESTSIIWIFFLWEHYFCYNPILIRMEFVLTSMY